MRNILIPALILVLAGCSTIVDDKYYVPEFTREHEECKHWGKSGCTDGKELNVKVPECYRLVIAEGLERTDICVSKDTWEKAQIGQEWTDETYIT